MKTDLVYQTAYSPEDLAVLTGIFVKALEDENSDDVQRAFALHVKRCKRFPTPAHIIELLPECRKKLICQTLPEKPSSRQTPGIGALYCRAFKGDMEAKAKLAELTRKVPEKELA